MRVTREMRKAVRREEHGGPFGPTPTPLKADPHKLARKRAKAARKITRRDRSHS